MQVLLEESSSTEAYHLVTCAACLAPDGGMLGAPLPAVGDEEGDALDASLPPVVDAHVHLFPPGLFEAIWRWFDQHGWPIRYRLHADAVVRHLRSRGVRHMVGLLYAHKPEMARSLNDWMASFASENPCVTGFATVFPGEPSAATILDEAFERGLGGVKLHCHVQCFAVDDPRLNEIYEACVRWGKPILIHAGREPKSPAYACDPHALCHASRVESVLSRYPALRLCVPHLGADEMQAYGELLVRHENLWLDTTMVLAEYFPMDHEACFRLLDVRPDRVMYGSDFPNIPYAWDREIRKIASLGLGPEALAALVGGNAAEFLGVSREKLLSLD